MSGFFFRRSTTTTPAPSSTADHILLQQLLSAAGHSMHVQPEEVGQQSVSAMAQADGLETRKQAALLFIEQTIEEQDGSLEFIRGSQHGSGIHGQGNGLGAPPG
jgi:hypothetical protein